MLTAIQEILNETLNLFIAMSPWLLFGFIIAGALHLLIPQSFIAKHLKPNKISSIFKAAILGVPLPLCSCGVIPVAAHLRKQGASKSATVSFLASTPSTGADSIMATYSLMGPIYAIVRPIDALFSGFLAGLLVKIFDSKDKENAEVNKESDDKASCCSNSNDSEEDTSCCSNSNDSKVEASCCASSNDNKDEDSCCAKVEPKSKSSSIFSKIKSALHYSIFELIDDTKKWLLIGIFAGGIIAWGMPEDLAKYWSAYPALSYLMMLVIGLPMYVCAMASIPIATALLANGLSPGAALVFLAVGPATNTATISFLSSTMGKKTTFIYIFSISLSAISLGLGIDFFFGESLQIYFKEAHHISHFGIIDYTLSAILAALIAYQYINNYIKKVKAPLAN